MLSVHLSRELYSIEIRRASYKRDVEKSLFFSFVNHGYLYERNIFTDSSSVHRIILRNKESDTLKMLQFRTSNRE